MGNLNRKYRNDCLTKEELDKLRKELDSTDDKQLEKEMFDVWMEEDFDNQDIDNETIDNLKHRINRQIESGKNRRHITPIRKIMQIAATILLPIFVISTIYLYHENKSHENEIMTVNTGKGEKASVILPDGTSIALNSSSYFRYNPQDFNKENRLVEFEGEAYFQVAKNPNKPFEIKSKGIEIQVLGTTFNLNVRPDKNIAELALENGRVKLTSTISNQSITMEKEQKAYINLSDGKITVTKDNNIDYSSAWKRGEIIFRNTRFCDVISRLEDNYGVQIETDYKNAESDLFTGTVTSNNLYEALEIISKTYNLDVNFDEDKIKLSE